MKITQKTEFDEFEPFVNEPYSFCPQCDSELDAQGRCVAQCHKREDVDYEAV